MEAIGEHGVVVGLGDVEAYLGAGRNEPELRCATAARGGAGLGEEASAGEDRVGRGQPGAIGVSAAERNLGGVFARGCRGIRGETRDSFELTLERTVVR